jgi:Raf kinase inhibitor-like YbhB/YbcL family protein
MSFPAPLPAILSTLLAITGCNRTTSSEAGPPAPAKEPARSAAPAPEGNSMKLTSSAFQDHAPIPSKYTCDGSDTIPPLAISDVPKQAKALALIVDDPDVPPSVRADRNWDHWVVWNIPPTTPAVAEGKAPEGVQGRNSWGKNAWGGPCPPDREHRYFFKLFALDTTLNLPPTAGKPELLKAMEGHIVAQTELVGKYDRKKK